MKKRISLALISICMLLSFPFTTVKATDFAGKESKYIKLCSSSKLTSREQKTCKEFNTYLSQKNKDLQKESNDTKKEIEDTKETIETISKEIDELEKKMSSTQQELTYIETSIKNLNDEIAEKQSLLEKRLYSMQTTINSPFFASIIFGSESITDLFSRLMSLKEITSNDTELIDGLESDMQEVKKQEATLQSTKQTLNSQKQEQASLQKKFVAKLTQQNETLASHTSEMSKNQESIEVIQKNLIAIQKASDASKVSNVTQATPNKKPSKPKPSNDNNSSKNEESTSSKDETSSSNDKEDNTTNKPDSSQDESQNENISSNEELGLAIANKALSRQGYMYVWGGGHSWSSIKDPNWTQFDCSGLVNWAHYQAGAPLSRIHYTGSLVSAGKSISRSELQAGDIILFSSNGKTSGVHHVGIYIGNNQMVHAPSTGKPVQVANLSYSYWQNEWFSTRRLY